MAGSFWKDILSGVIKTSLVAGIAAVAGWLSPPIKSFFQMVWSYIVAAWDWLWVSHAWPGWLLLLLTVSASILLVGILLFIYSSLTEKKSIQPPWFHEFSKYYFRGAEWRWQWSESHNIEHLWCYCPTCDGTLVFKLPEQDMFEGYLSDQVQFICEHCHHQVIATVPGYTLNDAKGYVLRELGRVTRQKQKEQQTN